SNLIQQKEKPQQSGKFTENEILLLALVAISVHALNHKRRFIYPLRWEYRISWSRVALAL
ncbi:MAG: hypothetical protein SNJ68_10475, partial [Cyanobacteriota bacterium]